MIGAHVTRGSGNARESVIVDAFAAEGLRPIRWSNAPGDTYATHEHGYDKVLYCLRGSIAFRLDGGAVELGPGDRLDIDAGKPHAAVVGEDGVECIEAARPEIGG